MRGKETGSRRSRDGGLDEGCGGQGTSERGRRKRARCDRSSSSDVRDFDIDDDSNLNLEDETPISSAGIALDNSMSGSTTDFGWGHLPVAYVLCGRLMPDSTAKTCYQSFRKKMEPKGYNWKAVSDTLIDDYFIEFKKQYSWPVEQEAVIKSHWKKMASTRYKDFCSRVIKPCVGKTKPPFIMEEDWPGWLEHFGSKKFNDLSGTNTNNRKLDKATKNTCGSKKILSYMIDMTKENGGIPPPFYKVQRRTHVSRKTGDFIDQRSKQVNEKVVSLVEGGEEGPNSMSKEEDDRHYVEVAGGVNKGYVYGLGAVGKAFASDSGNADTCSSSSSSLEHILSQRMETERAQMQEKMEAQMKEKMEIERAQMEGQMNEKMEKERMLMEAQMNEKMENERAQMDGKLQENSERMGQFEREMKQMKSTMAKYFKSFAP